MRQYAALYMYSTLCNHTRLYQSVSVWRRMKQNMEELKSFQLGVKLEFKQRVTWASADPEISHTQSGMVPVMQE